MPRYPNSHFFMAQNHRAVALKLTITSTGSSSVITSPSSVYFAQLLGTLATSTTGTWLGRVTDRQGVAKAVPGLRLGFALQRLGLRQCSSTTSHMSFLISRTETVIAHSAEAPNSGICGNDSTSGVTSPPSPTSCSLMESVTPIVYTVGLVKHNAVRSASNCLT